MTGIGDALHPVKSRIPHYDQVHAMRTTVVNEDGQEVNVRWDTITPSAPNAYTDVFAYSLNGATTLIMTLTYSDSSKSTFPIVTKDFY